MDEHAGHRSRLRKRLQTEGLEGFSSHETLELLLTYAIPRVNTNETAHRLIKRFGSFSGVLDAPWEELTRVEGVGPQAAALITMMVPMLRRYEQEKMGPGLPLDNYARVAEYCRTLFLGVNVEQCYVLCLDGKLKLRFPALLSQGTPGDVSIHPRVVLQELIRYNATGAIICHNHPSGSPEPSPDDVSVTHQIYTILESIGIHLYDHVIVSGQTVYSFKNNHLL